MCCFILELVYERHTCIICNMNMYIVIFVLWRFSLIGIGTLQIVFSAIKIFSKYIG